MDRWVWGCTFLLLGAGVWLIMASTPAIALQHKWSPFLLLKRHLVMVGVGLGVMLVTSQLREKSIVALGAIVGTTAWAGTLAVLRWGDNIKGARRWLTIGGMGWQPSEFLKPALCVVVAYILCQRQGYVRSGLVLFLVVLPLLAQPDLGMALMLVASWFGQCFVAGLPWIVTISAGASLFVAIAAACLYYPHAAHRIVTFLSHADHDPNGSQYQMCQALKSFASGGLWGKGPGAGTVVNHLPDCHADFVFAVAGEELGLGASLSIVLLYAIIVGRMLHHARRETEPFAALAIGGLTMQLGLQACFNMSSVLGLVPTKGLTLPLMSYGGSSLLSVCWTIGMLLALTRRYRHAKSTLFAK
jgi:cell division protein FtsW